MKSEFVSTVSHDLRSPLTLMRGYATMLDMVGNLNEQQQSYIRKIIAGVEEHVPPGQQPFGFGAHRSGGGPAGGSVSVLDILEHVTGLLQLSASQKNIALNLEIPRNLPAAVEADQALLHQAVYKPDRKCP